MPYCTRNDLTKRFGESEINDLLDRNNDGNDDNERLNAVIADSGSEINGYLGGRYAVPVPKPVAALRHISCDISRYLLWDGNAPEEVEKRYKRSVANLEKYRDGEMTLIADDGTSLDIPSRYPDSGVDYYAEERIFTQDTLRGF